MATCFGVVLFFLITVGGIYFYAKVARFDREIDASNNESQADSQQK